MSVMINDDNLWNNIAKIETEKEVLDLINNYSDLDYLLENAMLQRNKFLVKALINKGVNINHYCLLSYAVEKIRCPEILKMLIDRGANVNEENHSPEGYGVTYPLHCAMIEDPSLEQMKILLDNGAYVNPPKTFDGRSPIHFAVCLQLFDALELLLQYGANVHVLDYFNETPLHLATQLKQYDAKITKLLLEYDSNPREKDVAGNNPVENTLKFKKVHMLKTILKHHHHE